MRDIFVLLVVLGSLPLIIYRPYIGILVWSWLAYMNPHRLSWGFAYDFPFAQIVAIVIMVALVFSKEPKKIPWTRETIVLVIFVFWMLITTLNANYGDLAWEQYIKVIKIQVATFLTLIIMNDKNRLVLLAWAIALSLGFFGIKGGIFTAITGGGHHVLGPYGTFIGGNNELGLALIMTVPLMRFLQLTYDQKWIKIGMTSAIALTFIAILGTQSRGALLGVAAMGFMLAMKSRRRVMLLTMMVLLIPAALMIMPESWYERMSTIQTYEEDASAQGRLKVWGKAIDIAVDSPIVGGGFETFAGGRDVHSIYFEILAEHGFVGLFIFILLGFFAWRSCSHIIKRAKENINKKWMGDFAAMLQVSLLGYAVSGTFLGLAYFDLFYHIIAMIILLKYLDKQDNEIANPPENKEVEIKNHDIHGRFRFTRK